MYALSTWTHYNFDLMMKTLRITKVFAIHPEGNMNVSDFTAIQFNTQFTKEKQMVRNLTGRLPVHPVYFIIKKVIKICQHCQWSRNAVRSIVV